MFNVNALLNLGIEDVEDIYMSVDFSDQGTCYFYVYAVKKTEFHKYDTVELSWFYEPGEAARGLKYFKEQLLELRKEAAK